MSKDKVIVILGPTAAGKTALSIKLAKKFKGEIVCADSRQIYSEMAIGTASPFQNQSLRGTIPRKLYGGRSPVSPVKSSLGGVVHHLFNFVPPSKTFSVALYQKLAIKTIKDIQKRGKIPFLVGGSPFYIYSVVEGWRFPKIKADIKLRKELEKKSAEELFNILKKLDPERAKTIERKNKRRLVRAIEIAKTLGKVPKLKKNPPFDCLLIGIKLSKEELKKRTSQRVDKMIKSGLEKEVKKLVRKYGFNPVLQESIGYQEWQTYFQSSLNFCDKKKMIKKITAKIKLNTSRLAKHQMTWFKRDKRICWISSCQEAEKLAKNFLKQ